MTNQTAAPAESEQPTGPPADYPIWHGSAPMKPFLAAKLRADRFLVAGDGIRVRDAAGRWLLDARASCWNLSLGYSAEEVKEAIRRQLDEGMTMYRGQETIAMLKAAPWRLKGGRKW